MNKRWILPWISVFGSLSLNSLQGSEPFRLEEATIESVHQAI